MAEVEISDDARLAMAVELHDGVLQTLAAASLQLVVARRLLPHRPEEAAAVLSALIDEVSAEQRELRLYIDEMYDMVHEQSPRTSLRHRLEAMLDRVLAIWGAAGSLDLRLEATLGPADERHVIRLVREAVVNATRHGHAGKLDVTVRVEGGEAVVTVQDDGEGFLFRGEYEHEELKARKLGPVALRQRVESVNGGLFIRSAADGAVVRLTFPLQSDGKP